MSKLGFRPLFVSSMALAGVLITSASHASDGVIEINQTRALAGGVTASDAPGFPVTLDTSGSYSLTSDLFVSGLDASAIVVQAANVTLDLRGFTIQGGCPTTGCALGSGSGLGIDAVAGTGHQIRDGRIQRFAGGGLLIGPRSRVSGLLVELNGRDGIEASGQIEIVGTKASRNARFGINAGAQASLHESITDANAQGGIVVSGFSSVGENSTSGNSGGSGIRTGVGCLVWGNASKSNGNHGIDLEGQGGMAIDNSVATNSGFGIFVISGGSVHGNTIHDNGFTGLFANSTPIRTGYRNNVFDANAASVNAGGVNLGGNSCNGTTTCP